MSVVVEISEAGPYEMVRGGANGIDVSRITRLIFSVGARPRCQVFYVGRYEDTGGEYEASMLLDGPQVEALVLALQAARATA